MKKYLYKVLPIVAEIMICFTMKLALKYGVKIPCSLT